MGTEMNEVHIVVDVNGYYVIVMALCVAMKK